MENLKLSLQWQLNMGVADTIIEYPSMPLNDGDDFHPLPKKNQPSQSLPKQLGDHFTAITPPRTVEGNHGTKQLGDHFTAIPPPAQKQAIATAQACNSLDELNQALETFEGCRLKKTAENTILGQGNVGAQIMCIGHVPYNEEDRYGEPFSHKRKNLLLKMFKSIGYDSSELFLTNLLPWRPPGQRQPTAQEVKICQPFLEQQILLVKPKIVLFLDTKVAIPMLKIDEKSRNIHGQKFQLKFNHSSQTFQCFITYHPDILIKTPELKLNCWKTLIKLRKQ